MITPSRRMLALPPAVRCRDVTLSTVIESPLTPLDKLSIAMLERAIKDCQGVHDTTESEAREARWYLGSNDSSYFLSAVACCERLGISIKVVRQVIGETNG